ncbi:MAG: Gfo/Idh/MocA family oxidoreductase [Bacteroidota bacterium]
MITFTAMEPIKWGIIGPGKIARSFADDLKLVNNATLNAVASRNRERATIFAKDYGISHIFDNYDELFQSDEVEIVYIATPHVFHMDLTVQALEHGKHVLCEKPLGVNLIEVDKMIRTAKENKRFLMEALWSRFNPTIQRVKAQTDQGKLGELTYVNADFAFNALDRPRTSRLFNLDLAGGTLLDIGIYPVFLAYLFLGMPDEIKAVSNFDDYGTEIQTSILFQYPKAQAILNSSFTHNSRMSAEISGTKGTITLAPRFHEARAYTIRSEEEQATFEIPTQGRGYYYEIIEVNQCIRANKLQSELWSLSDSKNLISLLDQIRAITKISFPFER